MDQIKFIVMANNVYPEGEVKQDPNGITVVNLRPQIQITHNYKKKNEIKIIFNDTNDEYLVSSKNELEEIYGLHLANKDVIQILHEYCKNNLKSIK